MSLGNGERIINMNEVGVVISRYYEDLKWVEELKAPLDVYVYDRQGETPGMGAPHAVAWYKPKSVISLDVEKCLSNGINLEIINMEDDAGFEASTYAYHFYLKHDSLNEITVCLQGHPEIYTKNIIQFLNNPSQLMRTKFLPTNPNTPSIRPSRIETVGNVIDFEFVSDDFSHADPYHDYGWAPHKNNFDKAPWKDFCHSPEWPPKPYDFGAGNQFMVNKNLVLKHDTDYYKRLQEFTATYMDPNEQRPHWQQKNQGPNIMEGMWQYAF